MRSQIRKASHIGKKEDLEGCGGEPDFPEDEKDLIEEIFA